MKRKEIVVIVAVGVIALAVLGLLLLKPGVSRRTEKVRIGLLPDSVTALLYIANERGFFKRNGLDVSMESYQAGIFAVNDLAAGKVDVATATEFVLALQGFKRPDLRAIGTISSSDSIEVIARSDRGIRNPADLKGKLIGDSKGTATSFYLSSFLSLNSLRPKDIRMVDIRPAEMAAALVEGKIDAGVSFSPHLDKIKKALAGKAVSWRAQGGRDFYYLLITREEILKTRSGAMTRLLKSVIDAEAFLKRHERDAHETVMRLLGVDHDTLMSSWSKTRFRVSLDPSLVTLMEDEGRWAIRNKLVEAEIVPDYLTFLSREGLQKIKPEAVGAN